MMKRPVVLLVDDDLDMLECLEVALGPRYDLLLAGDGARALELAAASRVDVIVLDLMMPVVDGFAVLKHLEKSGSKVPVIIASAMQGLERIGRAFPVVDRITKPYSLIALEQRIERALESSPTEAEVDAPVSATRVSDPPMSAEPVDALDPEPPRVRPEDASSEIAAAGPASLDGQPATLNLV